MRKIGKYFKPLWLGLIGAACFTFGLWIVPIFYEVDFTNNNRSPLWDFVHGSLVLGGFLVAVIAVVWALLLTKLRSKNALLVACAVAALIYVFVENSR